MPTDEFSRPSIRGGRDFELELPDGLPRDGAGRNRTCCPHTRSNATSGETRTSASIASARRSRSAQNSAPYGTESSRRPPTESSSKPRQLVRRAVDALRRMEQIEAPQDSRRRRAIVVEKSMVTATAVSVARSSVALRRSPDPRPAGLSTERDGAHPFNPRSYSQGIGASRGVLQQPSAVHGYRGGTASSMNCTACWWMASSTRDSRAPGRDGVGDVALQE